MLFKGCKVYAQISQDGTLVEKDGVVKIKYQLQQENEYLARASAIQEITEHELKKMKHQREQREKPSTIKNPPPASEEIFDDNTIFVFTDGACTGNPGPAGIGVFFQYRDNKKDPTLPVALFTDSSYCYGVLTSSLRAKKNRDLVEEIKKKMGRFPLLKFFKVEGHKGIEGNEKANLLAQQAIAQPKGKNA